jgi:hypothetical protein
LCTKSKVLKISFHCRKNKKVFFENSFIFKLFYSELLILIFLSYLQCKTVENPFAESDIEDEDSFIVNDSDVEEEKDDDDVGNVRDDDDDDDDGDGDCSDDYGSDGGETRQKSRPNKR